MTDLLTVRLRRVDIFLTRGFANATDLPSGVISSLGLIIGNPGISQNELAQTLGVDKSIIVTLMHELERRGWARRTVSTKDRRRYELRATEQGEAELARLARDVKKFEDRLLALVPAEELNYMRDLLDRMHASCVQVIEQEGSDPLL